MESWRIHKNIVDYNYENYIYLYSPFDVKIARLPKKKLDDLKYNEKKLKDIFPNALNESKHRSEFKCFTSLTLFVTSSCNLNCIYCYAGEKKNFVMNNELAQKSIDYFISQYCLKERKKLKIGFHGGGEPTTNFNTLSFIVEYVKKNKKKWDFDECIFHITTNGCFTDKILDYLIKNEFEITISLDGPPDIQNKQRPLLNGGPSYDIVVKNINKLVNLDFRFSVRPTITSNTIIEKQNILKHFKEIGVNSVFWEPISLCGNIISSLDLFIEPEAWARSLIDAIEYAAKLNLKISNSFIRYLRAGRRDY